MQIQAIIQNINKQCYKLPLAQHQHPLSHYNSMTSPLCDTFTTTISFKKAEEKKETPFVTDPRELDLHCACCDRLMLKNKTVNEFLDKKIYFPAKEALERIKYEQYFRLHEKPPEMQRAYTFMKQVANQNPTLNFDELMTLKKVIEYKKHTGPKIREALEELRIRCREVSHDIRYVVKEIEKLNPDFQPTEEAVFQTLKRFAQIYPTETIESILNKPKIKEEYLSKLQKKQNNKLKKILPLVQQLSPKYSLRATQALNKAYKIFNKESSDVIHKRTRVIELFEKTFAPIKENEKSDKEIADLILKRLEQLPGSKNDLSAFMVKHANKSSNSTVEVLLTRIRNTKEHVKPENRKNDKGASDKKNYIYLCGKCNHDRMTEKYDRFIEKHPQMPENTQQQIDEICDYVNRGILDGHDTWPNDIKKALEDESEGLIVINTGKLNAKLARENRQIRLNEFIEKQRRKSFEKDHTGIRKIHKSKIKN